MGKFRLTGLFLVVAGLTFLGVAIAINLSTAKSETNRIIASTTEQSVEDAMVIAGIVTDLLENKGDPSLALPSNTESQPSLFVISEFLGDSNIVQLNLYTPEGEFIWSSTYDRSDVNIHQRPIFENTSDGTIASGLIRGITVYPPGAESYRADVVETFIPFMDPSSGLPAIVLGVTSDITEELGDGVGLARFAIFRSTMISLGLGFAVLFAAVLVVDVRLWNHRVKAIEHERALAAQELASTRLDLVNRELQQIDEERTRFISTVSHELKTPLTSIIALTEILSRSQSGIDKDRNVERLEIVKNSGDHLLTLIDDLLDYARFESGEKTIQREEFELDEVITEVASSLSPLLDSKEQVLVIKSDLERQRARLDRRRFLQVLMNLVSNASKYSPHGTTITIEGQIVDDSLQIAVTDQGVGISTNDQVRLFTKFFRGDNEATRSVSGTGLGLSIAREIVEAHGGTIGVQSSLGQGARFSVIIPTGMPVVRLNPNLVEQAARTRVSRKLNQNVPDSGGAV